MCHVMVEQSVDREALLAAFKAYLDANKLEADWESVERASNATLVNSMAMMSPYGPAEKQALLEAPDLKTRAETLIAITEIVLARSYGVAHGPEGTEIRIGLALAQEDLAQLLGASRQRVNQELKGFERDGAVRVEPTRLVVVSREKLMAAAER